MKGYIPPKKVTLKDGKRIQELLNYWNNLTKRDQLRLEDFNIFSENLAETLKLINKYFPAIKDKFLRRLEWGVIGTPYPSTFLEIKKNKELPDQVFVWVKKSARGLVRCLNKYFEPVIRRTRRKKSPIEDSCDILSQSSKLTYRWAAGIIIANYMAVILIQLLKKTTKIKRNTDDIKTLYDLLKKHTKKKELKKFLIRSYRRFEDADKTRNRCAHINEGEPTKQEIEQLISLTGLLEKFLK